MCPHTTIYICSRRCEVAVLETEYAVKVEVLLCYYRNLYVTN